MTLRCKLFGCSCVTKDDAVACWGECVRCGARHGYLERTYIRRSMEARYAYEAAWKEFTLPGMTP